MYDSILDALRRGATAEALAASEQLAGEQPNDVTAQRLHAAALRLDGQREAALAALDRAIGLSPEDAQLHLERAGTLLDGRQLDEAQAALAQAIGLDPNQFPAYVVKAQLAIARGDLEEGERLGRTAARIAPNHPQVAAIEGTLALRRGDADRALAILSHAASVAPDDPQVLHGLGFAYLAKGHLAFAEQAFSALAQRNPDQLTLQLLIADLLRQQSRYAEAADRIEPLIQREDAGFGVRRWAGELELDAGRNERALAVLREAFAEHPHDPRTLNAMMEAWRRLGAVDDARQSLEDALAAHPQQPDLWRARLVLEPFGEAAALDVIERWQQAMPDHLAALEARAAVHDQLGEHAQAEAIAERIVEISPGDVAAEMRLVQALTERDPDAAAERIERLIGMAADPTAKRELRQLLGRTLDLAGQPEAAAATWAELHAEVVEQRLPFNAISKRGGEDWPPLGWVEEGTRGILLLWGAPGSRVERIAQVLSAVGAPLLVDRYGPQPPNDPMQRYGTVEELLAGSLDPAFLIKLYRAALPARGAADGPIFDWLLWWDNALLRALRPNLAEAFLLIPILDPRDMLLDWLANGSPTPYALTSPEDGARWLAQTLEQVADLHEHNLFPHNLVRLDQTGDDPGAIAQIIADTLRVQVSLPGGINMNQRLPSGRWRAYIDTLGEAFALLKPVAKRLGYPEA
ncbi:tetratricopeptide repeat protein [Pseudomonas sp. CGJS7]|uniref:tetratricopeptide repeat protein n=1 Tax=Pseudomonas sp. CGJS7 TaxID=3109348 RepID=UPI00300BE47F